MERVLIICGDIQRRLALRSALQYSCEVTEADSLDGLEEGFWDCLAVDRAAMERLRTKAWVEQTPVLAVLSGSDEAEAALALKHGAWEVACPQDGPQVLCRRVENLLRERDRARELEQCQARQCRDALTGLLNAEGFRLAVLDLLAAGTAGALYLIDLDDLKYINDHLGHQTGTKTITAFAQAVEACFSGPALAAHLSGDEFAAYVPLTEAETGVQALAENLQNQLCREVCGVENRVTTASIGIALYPRHGRDYDSLFERADEALRWVKNHGKNGCHLAQDSDRVQRRTLGRQTCTHSRLEALLTPRSGETQRLWIPFGAMRLIWNQEPGRYQAALVTLRARDGGPPEQAALEGAARQLEETADSRELPGLFCWYSVNELLWLRPAESQADTDVLAACFPNLQTRLGLTARLQTLPPEESL